MHKAIAHHVEPNAQTITEPRSSVPQPAPPVIYRLLYGIKHLLGQFGSTIWAESPPSFLQKLTLSQPNQGQHAINLSKKCPLQKQSHREPTSSPVLKSSFVASFSEGHFLLTWKDALGEPLVHLPLTFYTVSCLSGVRRTYF